MYSTLLTSLENGIFTITVNRPDKMNALNKDVIMDLGKALDEVYNNPEIKSAILTGAGEKAFVAGADISEFTVNGFSLGGGCELAMSCHFRIASENAKFGQPEVNLGLIPGYGGTQRLTQLIGKGKSMELMMTGDMIGAEEAKALGLVNHVFPIADLLTKAKEILTKIQTKAPIAVSHIIALVNGAAKCEPNGFENEIERFGACFDSEDMKEGTSAFLEKRKPAFKGK